MRVRTFGLGLLLIAVSATAAGAVDYYHRDAARPNCRTMRIDDGRRIAEKHMCRGEDGEWHEEMPEDAVPQGDAPEDSRAARHDDTRADTSASDGALIAPDNSAIAATTVHSLSVRLSNIDDLGMVMLIGPDRKPFIATGAEWNVRNQGGEAHADLGSRIKTGHNLIVFILHNKRWILGASKYAFDAALVGDGRELWHNRRTGYQAPVGIRYWKAFHVLRGADGGMLVESAQPVLIERLRPHIAELDRKLIRCCGTEQSAYGLAATAMVAAIVSGMSSGSGEPSATHRTPQPCYDYAAPGCGGNYEPQ